MIPISLQMWSLRDDTANDFVGTIEKVAAMGFTGVELAGTGNTDVNGAVAAIKKAGLKVSGLHVGMDPLRNKLPQVISEAKMFATKDVIMPFYAKETFTSVDETIKLGLELAEIGAKLRAEGLRLSYHNHDGEFVLLDGRPALEVMLDAVAPRDLKAEIDLFWVNVTGVDPVAVLRRLGDRVPLLHLKDGVKGKQSELGLGEVPFKQIFAAAEEIGAVEWYVVEQEQYNHAPLESIRLCFEQLKKWGKA